MIAVARNDMLSADVFSRSGLWINEQKVHARSRSKKIAMHRRRARRSVNRDSVADRADDPGGTDGMSDREVTVADGGQIHGMSREQQ